MNYLDHISKVEDMKDTISDFAFKMYQQGRQDMYNELQDTEIKAHDKYIREEFIERIYSKFNQDSTLSIALKNTMNDILKEYN